MTESGRGPDDRGFGTAESQAVVEAAREADALVDRAGARDDHVEVRQRGAERVEAETVSIVQGGAARVDARQVDVHQGGVALARTDRLTLREQSSALAVVAARAEVSDSNVFVLLARDVTGSVRPVLDWRAAAAFGVAFAIVSRLLRWAVRR